jgi:thymidylate synthase
MENLSSSLLSTNIRINREKHQHEEYQYLHLLDNIIENGHREEGRNGITKSIFGSSMRFSLQNNKIPILTTKKTAWKTCLKELLWFIHGDTHNSLLKSQGVHIWDANASREYLDSQGLSMYEPDELGPIYGHQFRHFNKPYSCQSNVERMVEDEVTSFHKPKHDIDQLQNIINSLKNPKERTSRRMIMTAWNPCQLHQMALPPCHILCQFNVHDGNKLSCAMYQRSNDECCGTPFNIASYSLLTHLLAKHCDLEAYEFVYFKGNCHIYEGHLEGAKLQTSREPFPFPTLSIRQVRENIDDYLVSDFEIHNYQHHEPIKYEMVA